jgi:hypothetical protein
MKKHKLTEPIKLDLDEIRAEAQAIQAALRCATVRLDAREPEVRPVGRLKTILL